MEKPTGLEQLRHTVEVLLGDSGCEWDRAQDHRSLIRYLIEEVYELVDAIESDDSEGVREELGDVLYQVVFHAEIARRNPEEGFDLDEVASRTDQKMRTRHPHVFGDVEVSSIDDIRRNWLELKRSEKPARTGPLDGLPGSIQGIARAQQVLDRASRAGIDFPVDPDRSPTPEDEWGRWLLRQVATARSQGVDLDRALRRALQEFEQNVTTQSADEAPGAPAE